MSSAEHESNADVHSDEDWKNRVKAEAAALDEQFRQSGPKETAAAEKPSPGTPEEPAARELPRATFGALLGMLSTEAMVALGIIPQPGADKAESHLPVARYLIDLIAVLEEKTAGNLSKDEAQALDETLHSLRMTFVQRSKEK